MSFADREQLELRDSRDVITELRWLLGLRLRHELVVTVALLHSTNGEFFVFLVQGLHAIGRGGCLGAKLLEVLTLQNATHRFAVQSASSARMLIQPAA